jgi:hypothetical protein
MRIEVSELKTYLESKAGLHFTAKRPSWYGLALAKRIGDTFVYETQGKCWTVTIDYSDSKFPPHLATNGACDVEIRTILDPPPAIPRRDD